MGREGFEPSTLGLSVDARRSRRLGNAGPRRAVEPNQLGASRVVGHGLVDLLLTQTRVWPDDALHGLSQRRDTAGADCSRNPVDDRGLSRTMPFCPTWSARRSCAKIKPIASGRCSVVKEVVRGVGLRIPGMSSHVEAIVVEFHSKSKVYGESIGRFRGVRRPAPRRRLHGSLLSVTSRWRTLPRRTCRCRP